MDGLVVVWKEKGMTSHDVVFKLRKIFKMKRIGHCGTLDPEVEGVLVVCLGQATKLVEFLMDGKKTYQGEIVLGQATDTEDGTGQLIAEAPIQYPLDDVQIDHAMAQLTGLITQTPPYYSAVKVNGKRLYEYARAGIEVQRPQRQVTIYRFKRLGPSIYDPTQQVQTWKFDVVCSKGTYVRTLAVDCGQLLGYPSHMSQLTRTQAAGFKQEQAYRLSDLEKMNEKDELHKAVISLNDAVQAFPHYVIDHTLAHKIKNGQVLEANLFEPRLLEATALFYQGQLMAIYGPHPEKAGFTKPIKMFSYKELKS